MSSKVCNIKLYMALNVLWQVMVVNWSSRWESPKTAMIQENPVHRSSLSQGNSEKEALRIIHLPSYNRCFWILLVGRNKFWFRHSSTCKVYVWQSWNQMRNCTLFEGLGGYSELWNWRFLKIPASAWKIHCGICKFKLFWWLEMSASFELFFSA